MHQRPHKHEDQVGDEDNLSLVPEDKKINAIARNALLTFIYMISVNGVALFSIWRMSHYIGGVPEQVITGATVVFVMSLSSLWISHVTCREFSRHIQAYTDRVDKHVLKKNEFLNRMYPFANILRIRDAEIRDILMDLGASWSASITEALNHDKVHLKLDDLYSVVSKIIRRSSSEFKAVDVDIMRWSDDYRARKYMQDIFHAMKRGAKGKRLYVINPHITIDELDRAFSVIEKHREQFHGMSYIARAIYFADVGRETRRKDFIISKNEKGNFAVLYETFDDHWRTTYEGAFSKSELDLAECDNIFETLWEKAQESERNWNSWCEKTRDRVATRSAQLAYS